MITELYIKPIKGEAPVPVDFMNITESGITGDCHAKGGDRAICFVTKKTADELKNIENKFNCIKKFSPNIVFDTDRDFAVGDTVRINTAVAVVTAVGRDCHELCDIPYCPLIKGIIFARVEKCGTISVGDKEIYD